MKVNRPNRALRTRVNLCPGAPTSSPLFAAATLLLLFGICTMPTALADDDADDEINAKVEAGAVQRAMVLSGGGLLASLLFFEFLRWSSFFRANYRPSMVKPSEPVGENLWSAWRTCFGWMKLPHRHGRNEATLREDIKAIGLEALVLNRYLNFGVGVTRWGAFGAVILCPLYTYEGGGDEESWVMKASTKNIKMDTALEQDWAFVIVSGLSFAISINTLFSVVREYNWFMKAWREALDMQSLNEDTVTNDATVMYGRAILLEDIPRALGPTVNHGELLLPFFQRLFPAVNGYPRVVSANSYSKEKYDWAESYRRFVLFNDRRRECLSSAPRLFYCCVTNCNAMSCGTCCDCLSEERNQDLVKELEKRTEAIEQGIENGERMAEHHLPFLSSKRISNIAVNIESPATNGDNDFTDADFTDETKEQFSAVRTEPKGVENSSGGPDSNVPSNAEVKDGIDKVLELKSFDSLDLYGPVPPPNTVLPPAPPAPLSRPPVERIATRVNLWRAPSGDVQLSAEAEGKLDNIVDEMADQQEDHLDQRGFCGWLCRCRQLNRIWRVFAVVARYINYLLCCATVERTTSTGFVVFDSYVAKVVCNEVLVTESNAENIATALPEPPMKTLRMPNRNDILWKNVTKAPHEVEVRHSFIALVSTAGVLGWYGIVGFWSTLTAEFVFAQLDDDNPENMESVSAMRGFLTEYVPVVVVVILLNLVPIAFRWLAVHYIGFKTNTEVNVFVARNYSSFQFANVYISIVASSIVGALDEILRNPYTAHKSLAEQLPNASEYLLLTVIFRFGLMANYLLQFDRVLKRMFCWQTSRAEGNLQLTVDATSARGLKDLAESIGESAKDLRNNANRTPAQTEATLTEAEQGQDSKMSTEVLPGGSNLADAAAPASPGGTATTEEQQLEAAPSSDDAALSSEPEERSAEQSVAVPSAEEESEEGGACEIAKVAKAWCCHHFRCCRKICTFFAAVRGAVCCIMQTAWNIIKVMFGVTKEGACCVAHTATNLVFDDLLMGDKDAEDVHSGLEKQKTPPPLFAQDTLKYYLIFPEVQIILVIVFLLWVICPLVSVIAFAYFLLAREIFGFITRYWREDYSWNEGSMVKVRAETVGDEEESKALVRRAEITRVVYDGTFDVKYEDNEEEEFAVEMERIDTETRNLAGIAAGSVWFFSVYSRTTACLIFSQALAALYMAFKEAQWAASLQGICLVITWTVRRTLYTGYEQRQSALTLVQAANRDHGIRRERLKLEQTGTPLHEALRVPREEIEKEFSQPGYKAFEHVVQARSRERSLKGSLKLKEGGEDSEKSAPPSDMVDEESVL